MSETGEKLTRFLRELQRRKTIRVAAAYLGFGLILIAGASDIIPAFQTPDWVLRTVIIVVLAGLPVAIVLSWIFDITPEGVKRTEDLDRDVESTAEVEAEEVVVDEVKPSIAVPLGTAQRRQVSILRCTFSLNEEGAPVTDPEALRAVMPAYGELAERVAERFAGYNLESGGATFEIVFGYPLAYENDAVRAVAAAFAVQRDAAKLSPSVGGHDSLKVVPTIGVHSDLVIIEESGDGEEAARVVGGSSEVAGWLQTLSRPGSITLSSATYALLGSKVRCESAGAHTNAGSGETVDVYRAEEILSPEDMLAAHSISAHKVYGRGSELALIMDRWEMVQDGEGQFVVLRGEPGIGKSTLVRKVVASVLESGGAQVMSLYCSPFETSNAFHPIIEFMFGTGLELEQAESDAHRASRVARLLTDSGLDVERAAPLMNTLLKFGDTLDDDQGRRHSGEELRKEMLNCLVELFHSAARRRKLLLLIEDIHFADPSTLEFLDMIVNSGSDAGALCLFTTRPTLNLDWESRSDVTVLDLQRLSRRVTENLIRDTLGEQALPDTVVAKIVKETGGNPLFAEELTKAVAESVGDSGADAETKLILPGTLQQSLTSRIDRLGSARPLLQLCSLLGRRFDYRLLIAVSKTENEEALQSDLRGIVNAGFLFQEGAVPDSSYRFKHILMQESAESSLLRETRVALHALIAETLEEQFTDRAQRQPELLAVHYGEGGQPDKAVMYWTLASKRSLETFAIDEAIEQAEQGLKTIAATPESAARDTAEIRLLSLKGKGLLTKFGYANPTVEEIFTQALKLSESIGQSPELFQIVVGLWMYFFIGGETGHALSLSRRLKRIAEAQSSPARSLQAHYCHGYTLYRAGRYADAKDELELALGCEENEDDFASESPSGDDTRIHVRCILAHVLWHLGDEQQSLATSRDARTMADEVGNPYGIVFADFLSCWLHALRLEPAETARQAARVVEMAEEHGFRFFLPLGNFMLVWSSFDGGQTAGSAEADERIEQMAGCVQLFIDAGASNGVTWFLLEIAEQLVGTGQVDAADAEVARAKQYIEDTGERFFEAGVLRIEGLIAQRRGDDATAEQLLSEAASAARRAGSLGLVARATLALAELHRASSHTGNAEEPVARAEGGTGE